MTPNIPVPAGNAVHIDIDVRDPAWEADIPDLQELCNSTVEAAIPFVSVPAKECELSIVLCDDAMQSELNQNYRGKPGPTNVLSFPSGDIDVPSEDTYPFLHFGDVVIARETVIAESSDLGIAPRDHLRHLLLHGFLHLLGFDHEDQEGAEQMERMEIEILATVGVRNPYADGASRDKIANEDE